MTLIIKLTAAVNEEPRFLLVLEELSALLEINLSGTHLISLAPVCRR